MPVHLTRVNKTFGDQVVLDQLDFRLRPGEFVALQGRNGAGKSTLASLCTGLMTPTEGAIHCSDKIGLVSQALAVYPTLSVEDNLRPFCTLAGMPFSKTRDSVLDLVELAEQRSARVGTLSGGQKRRLHIAIALVTRPDILWLDEPTVGLDVEARDRLLLIIEQLLDDGIGVCYTTHHFSELDYLAEKHSIRVNHLRDGCLILDEDHDSAIRRLCAQGFRCRLARLPDRPIELAGAQIRTIDDVTIELTSVDETELSVAQVAVAIDAAGAQTESIEPLKSGFEQLYRVLEAAGSQ